MPLTGTLSARTLPADAVETTQNTAASSGTRGDISKFQIVMQCDRPHCSTKQCGQKPVPASGQNGRGAEPTFCTLVKHYRDTRNKCPKSIKVCFSYLCGEQTAYNGAGTRAGRPGHRNLVRPPVYQRIEIQPLNCILVRGRKIESPKSLAQSAPALRRKSNPIRLLLWRSSLLP